MFKKIIFGNALLFALQINAQQGTASPYSAHGLGESKFRGTVENRAMGGLTVLNDSIHVNIGNPASFQAIKLSTFTVGGTFSSEKLEQNLVSEKAQRTTIDYVAMAFPAGKLSFGAGLYPVYRTGYKIYHENSTTGNRYLGNGAVYRSFITTGYEINKKLNIGIEVNYDFGKIGKETYVTANEDVNGTLTRNNLSVSGANVKGGVVYKTTIGKLSFLNGASLFLPLSLKVEQIYYKGIYSTVSNKELVPNEYVTTNNLTRRNPSAFCFSSSIGKDRKWLLGIESTVYSKGDLAIDNNEAVRFENGSKIILGGYYTPNFRDFNNFLNKITYRAGLRYENTGLVFKGNSVRDRAITAGIGLPIGGTFSNLNIGFEYGKKGVFNTVYLQEKYVNLSIGISFNDRWFIKRKYD